MKVKPSTVFKAIVVFLAVGFAIPVLSDRKIDGIWVLSAIGISLAITVLPAILVERFKGEKQHGRLATSRRTWLSNVVFFLNRKPVRLVFSSIILFVLMTFLIPSLEGRKVDTAWIIISAISAPLAAVLADYLTDKQRQRNRKN
jgi:hypothetical protein